ncbi:hypothetical protein B566_EDAN007551 [Ephemera danica]|nr:hypothetical protein B566_EDAN007551 [Ephemera danica]
MYLEAAITNKKMKEPEFSDYQLDMMKLPTSEEHTNTSTQTAFYTSITNSENNDEKYIAGRYIHNDSFLTADHCQKFGLDWLSTYDCLEGLNSFHVAQWSSIMLLEGVNIHAKGWSGAPIIARDQIMAFEGLDLDGNICTRKNYNEIKEFCSNIEDQIIHSFKDEPRIKLTGYDCDIIQNSRGVYTDPNQIITRVVHRDGAAPSFHGFPDLCTNKVLPTVEKDDNIEKLIYGVVPAFYSKEILQCGSPIFKDKKLVSVITQCYDDHYYTVSGISDFSGHIRTESYERKIVEAGEAVYGVTSAPYAVIKALAIEKSHLEPAGSSSVTLFAFKTQVRTDVTVTTENGVELLHLRYKASMINKPCI